MAQENFKSRRLFVQQSALSLLGLSILPAWKISPYIETIRDEKTIRSISYNVFNGCIGYKGINGRQLPPGEQSILVKTARNLGQIPIRIAQELALYQPNIINFSEAPDEKIVALMADILDMNYVFFSGGQNGAGRFPGAILTNYEILSSENRPFASKDTDHKELFTRHWGKVKLLLPNGKSLIVHSAHLWPFHKEENDTKIRLKEIAAIHDSVNSDLADDVDSVILQGDLNHPPNTVEYEHLNSGKLVDMFKTAGKGDGFTTNAIKPYKRLDYLYCAGALSEQIKEYRVLFEGNFRMNNDDPNGFALSDHLPVLADFWLNTR
ncbi:endonuclease/exonuclease/phosphatase family protein [Sinomicrobium sp.]